MRRVVKSVKVKAARRRIEAANANVTEEKKLGNLTTSALDYLLRCQQLSTILDALMKLGKLRGFFKFVDLLRDIWMKIEK